MEKRRVDVVFRGGAKDVRVGVTGVADDGKDGADFGVEHARESELFPFELGGLLGLAIAFMVLHRRKRKRKPLNKFKKRL